MFFFFFPSYKTHRLLMWARRRIYWWGSRTHQTIVRSGYLH